MQTASAAGFYGKLPCKGDFLLRRVAQGFVDIWDAWLQQCLLASREQLQERWLNAYLTSPVWRFALAEGVCGSGAYAGVMVPSVDRVGRYFPLTLVAQLSTEDCLLNLASEGARQWFDAAESLLLQALQAHDLELPAFDEQVAALAGPLRGPETAESGYLRELMHNSALARQPGQWQIPLQSVHSLQNAANVFASRELERTLRPLTLWWTDGSDAVAPCWLCNRGLPVPASFTAMIAGGWEHFGWESLGPRRIFPGAEATTDMARMADDRAECAQLPAGSAGEEGTAPPFESIAIVARHAAVARQLSVSPRVYYVSRPDVGLWGLSCNDGHEAGSAVAQAVADVLHDISTAGSLTALAEEVRRALEVIRRPSAVYGATAEAGAVVFLMRGNECAVVCAGWVQAVRVRSPPAGRSEVTTIEGTSQWMRTDTDRSEPVGASVDTSLLDLLAVPEESAEATVVHYDTLRSGDVWVLSGVLLFETQRLGSLPALLAKYRTDDDAMLSACRRVWGEGMDVEDNEFPLMLLAASPAG
jgi:type VI secretion system protein ImpM